MGYGESKQALDNIKIICYTIIIYAPQTLHRRVLDWCYFYINHPGGSLLVKTINEYGTIKALSQNQNCMLSIAIYANSSKIEILFMITFDLRTIKN